MTSTADTTRHPDVSEISDLAEGLLSPSRSAVVRLHLDACSLCADVRTSLEEIRGLLGTLPGPPRMPAEIAGRIDAALAAEALLDSRAPDTAAHVSRETPRSRPADTAPAADRPVGRSSAPTGPGRPRGRRRRRAVLGAVVGGAALGLSLFFVQSGVLNVNGDGSGAKTTSDTAASAAGTARFDGLPIEVTAQALLQQDSTFKAPRTVPSRSPPRAAATADSGPSPLPCPAASRPAPIARTGSSPSGRATTRDRRPTSSSSPTRPTAPGCRSMWSTPRAPRGTGTHRPTCC